MAKLKIKLLGKFEIFLNGEKILENINQSKKTRDFLIYLILRKDKAVLHCELFETLWSDDENVNPETALRTLLYRYRKLLTENNISELKDSIVTLPGSYQWNPELDCEIDVFEFEKFCRSAVSTQLTQSERISLFTQAMQVYTGDLVSVSSGRSWIVPRSIYYHDLYVKSMLSLIDLLKAEKLYTRIIQVCQRALEIEQFDDRLHLELIQALMETGQNQAALSLYKITSEIYYKQLGIAPSEKIRSLYKSILRIGRDTESDINKIQSSIDEEDATDGAFICEYGTFKDIYNLQKRLMERSNGTIFIALLTLHVINDEVIEPGALDILMQQLITAAQKSLRKGDTIARYSSMQYVIMLPSVTFDTGKIAMERIKKAFYKENIKVPVMLSYKMRPLGHIDTETEPDA